MGLVSVSETWEFNHMTVTCDNVTLVSGTHARVTHVNMIRVTQLSMVRKSVSSQYFFFS